MIVNIPSVIPVILKFKDSLNFNLIVSVPYSSLVFKTRVWLLLSTRLLEWLGDLLLAPCSYPFNTSMTKYWETEKRTSQYLTNILMIISHQFHFIFRFLASHQNIDVAKRFGRLNMLWRIKNIIKTVMHSIKIKTVLNGNNFKCQCFTSIHHCK